MKSILLPLAVIFLALGTALRAEEGGSGHYLPGSMSSFVDGVPADKTFIARYNFVMWDASVDANRNLPIAGLLTAGADITSYANAWRCCGGRPSANSTTAGPMP